MRLTSSRGLPIRVIQLQCQLAVIVEQQKRLPQVNLRQRAKDYQIFK
jgi:hypothetical protein